ncbi:MAG: hypothetical protein ACTSVV_10765 [Promethearchaeota archaeon]
MIPIIGIIASLILIFIKPSQFTETPSPLIITLLKIFAIGILLFLLAIGIYFIYKFLLTGFSIKNFAREIAKTQIKCFNRNRKRYPNLSFQNLLKLTLSQRPGLSEEEIEDIAYGCKNLKDMCFNLVIHEFEKRLSRYPNGNEMSKLILGVSEAFEKYKRKVEASWKDDQEKAF